MLRAFTHELKGDWRALADPTKISESLEAGLLVWADADVDLITRQDIETIATELGLHPLAVEDAFNTRQRPKFESYEHHLFVVVHQLDIVKEQLEPRQIACFAAKGFVLTLHAGASRIVDLALQRRWGQLRDHAHGSSWIMHSLLDTLVDDYQSMADDIELEVERLEDDLLENPAAPSGARVYSIKQRLSRLRRYAFPGSRALTEFLARADAQVDTKETANYFRDVLDHLMRITDQVRNVDDLLDALLELRRTEQTNALNEVTKRLTGWAAIIAVPTFIASVYGMNFDLIPDSGGRAGFLFSVGLMAASAVALYVYFRRRKFI